MKNYTDYTFFLSDSTIGKTPVFFILITHGICFSLHLPNEL